MLAPYRSLRGLSLLLLLFGASPARAGIERASVGPGGQPLGAAALEAAVSADGRVVAFTTAVADPALVPGCPGRLYLRDRVTGITTCVPAAGGDSPAPALSADGRFVAFRSMVGGGATPPVVQTFVHDRVSGQTEMVSVTSDGTPANTTPAHRDTTTPPALSADGRFVAFGSDAGNLPRPAGCFGLNVYVHDRLTGQTAPGSTCDSGTGRPALSADGRVVAWAAPQQPATYVRDLATGITGPPVAGIGPALSADGRLLAVASAGGGVLIHDRLTGATTRVDVASDRTPANGSACPAIPCQAALSADGRVVVFSSAATNLVSGDTNGVADVFRHDRASGRTDRVSLAASGEQADGASGAAAVSGDGTVVVFVSEAGNLVAGDANGLADVFAVTLDAAGADPPPPGAFAGGVFVAAADLDGDGRPEIVTGADAGGAPHVRAFTLAGTPLALGFFAYDVGFAGGVRVAACDVDGDGRAELVVAAGPGGGPHVRVLAVDPLQAAPVAELAGFYAYAPTFAGGVYVACGDLDGDGVPEIVTGAGEGGGPHVRAFRLAPGAPGGVVPVGVELFAYAAAFTGGVRVAVGETGEIVTAAGPGGGPHVRVFRRDPAAPDGVTEAAPGFFAYEPGFSGGVFVAAGPGEIVTGAGAGGGPHVRRFAPAGGTGPEQASFFAYDAGFAGGVRVAVGGGVVITAPGPGGGPQVRVFSPSGLDTGTSFFAY